MGLREYCRYIHPYSELEGLQQAHTVGYSASRSQGGVLLEVWCKQGGRIARRQAFWPGGEFRRAMLVMRYLCENGVGLEQWMEVLDDLGVPHRLVDAAENPAKTRESTENSAQFVSFAGF